jgi:hypothetical protein
LLGYYQSTTGDGRLAIFDNGSLILSFYEKYFYNESHDDYYPTIDRIYIADNLGVENSKLSELRESKLGTDSGLIDTDFIYDYFKSESWVVNSKIDYFDWRYLHLEQIK